MNETFGQAIKRVRRKHWTTQKELASILGVSAATVSKWELGQLPIEGRYPYSLARMYSPDLDQFLVALLAERAKGGE